MWYVCTFMAAIMIKLIESSEQDGQNFADDIIKCTFIKYSFISSLISISLKWDPIDLFAISISYGYGLLKTTSIAGTNYESVKLNFVWTSLVLS